MKRKHKWKSIIVTIYDDDKNLYDVSWIVDNKETPPFIYEKNDVIRLVRGFMGG